MSATLMLERELLEKISLPHKAPIAKNKEVEQAACTCGISHMATHNAMCPCCSAQQLRE